MFVAITSVLTSFAMIEQSKVAFHVSKDDYALLSSHRGAVVAEDSSTIAFLSDHHLYIIPPDKNKSSLIGRLQYSCNKSGQMRLALANVIKPHDQSANWHTREVEPVIIGLYDRKAIFLALSWIRSATHSAASDAEYKGIAHIDLSRRHSPILWSRQNSTHRLLATLGGPSISEANIKCLFFPNSRTIPAWQYALKFKSLGVFKTWTKRLTLPTSESYKYGDRLTNEFRYSPDEFHSTQFAAQVRDLPTGAYVHLTEQLTNPKKIQFFEVPYGHPVFPVFAHGRWFGLVNKSTTKANGWFLVGSRNEISVDWIAPSSTGRVVIAGMNGKAVNLMPEDLPD